MFSLNKYYVKKRLAEERAQLELAEKNPNDHTDFLFSEFRNPNIEFRVNTKLNFQDRSKNKKGYDSLCKVIEGYCGLVRAQDSKLITNLKDQIPFFNPNEMFMVVSDKEIFMLTSIGHHKIFGQPVGYTARVISEGIPDHEPLVAQLRFRQMVNTVESDLNNLGIDYLLNDRILSKPEKHLTKIKKLSDHYVDLVLIGGGYIFHDYIPLLANYSESTIDLSFLGNPIFIAALGYGIGKEVYTTYNNSNHPRYKGKTRFKDVGTSASMRFFRDVSLGVALYNNSITALAGLGLFAISELNRLVSHTTILKKNLKMYSTDAVRK